MELLFPLHCCFVYLVFVVVVVNGGANEKQMTWRLALEKQSDWDQESPVQKGGDMQPAFQPIPALLLSKYTQSLCMPRNDWKREHNPLQLTVQFVF